MKQRTLSIHFLILGFFLLGFNSLQSQTSTLNSQKQSSVSSTINGNITSEKTSEPLFGATVMIMGTSVGAVADFDGHFQIPNVKAGRYKLVVKSVAYLTDTLSLTIEEEKDLHLTIKLKDEYLSLEEITVQAKSVQNTSQSVLTMKQQSAKVMDGISANEISKRGDANIASAAKRITGVTVEQGKYVYVRGLSDRYSKTLVNHSEVPGLDPNRNTVQLDLFPSNFIENISISKSFSPDLPGDFSGGAVDIQTKNVASSFTFGFSSGISVNTRSSFNPNFISHRKGSLDGLAFDDGERNEPLSVQSAEVPALFENNYALQNVTQSFSKEMDVSQKTSGLDHNYSVQVGNEKALFSKPIRYFVGATYKKTFDHYQTDAITGRYNLTGNASEVTSLVTNRSLRDTRSSEQSAFGVLGNLQYAFSPNHTLGVQVFRNQNASTDARFSEGEIPMDAPGVIYQTRSLGYLQRSMQFAQLYGNHAFSNQGKLTIDWIASRTTSTQDEPDLRFFNNDYELTSAGDTLYRVQGALYNVPTRFYRHLKETANDVKANFAYRFNPDNKESGSLKAGFSILQKERRVSQNRYNYQLQGVTYNGNVNAFFSNDNMQLPGTSLGNGSGYMYISDATEKRNQYIGKSNVYAAYLLLDTWVNNRLRVNIGARVERAEIALTTADPSIKNGYLLNTDLLPSLNTTYKISKHQNLRFSYGRTLARPTFREIAPFADYDFATGWVQVGNGNLERGLNDNLDVRWETYPGFGEVFSVGLFAKRFYKPIELVFNPLAANATPEITWVNTGSLDGVQNPNAYLYGAEFEVKKQLFSKTQIGSNIAIIRSVTEIDSLSYAVIKSGNQEAKNTRTMFGQAPYVVNAYIEQAFDSTGISAIVSYNVSGPKLAVVMLGGLPDVYELPVHSLDFSIQKQINDRFSIRFSAKNLLDPIVRLSHEFKGESYTFNSYRRGRSFGLSVNYNVF